MEKTIQEYLHLYYNCDMWVTRYTPRMFKVWEMLPEIKEDLEDFDGKYQDRYKLILRPLSDMTEEEHEEMCDIRQESAYKNGDQIFMESESTRYLLSKCFDLFGLIESGLAIDSTKTNKANN